MKSRSGEGSDLGLLSNQGPEAGFDLDLLRKQGLERVRTLIY